MSVSEAEMVTRLRSALRELAPWWDPEVMAEVDVCTVRSGDLGFVDSLPLPLVRVPGVDAPLRVLVWYLVRRALAGVVARVRAAIGGWRRFDYEREQAALAGEPREGQQVKALIAHVNAAKRAAVGAQRGHRPTSTITPKSPPKGSRGVPSRRGGHVVRTPVSGHRRD